MDSFWLWWIGCSPATETSSWPPRKSPLSYRNGFFLEGMTVPRKYVHLPTLKTFSAIEYSLGRTQIPPL
jgi:hypothetical protein